MHVVTVNDERIRTMLPVHLLTAAIDHRQEPRSRPDGADFYQFLYLTKGDGVFESPAGRITVPEGSTVFTAKHCPISYRAAGEAFRTGWVAFDGPQVAPLLSYLSGEPFAVLRSETVRGQMTEIYRRAERGAPAEVLAHALFGLLVTFFGELREEKKPPALDRAKAYVEEHSAEDLSVGDVAAAVGISESLLFRIFREEEHTTPFDFLRSVRMKNAKELLIGSKRLRVAEIAARTGFSDAAYFCKVFKAETGMTPRTYRARFAQ